MISILFHRTALLPNIFSRLLGRCRVRDRLLGHRAGRRWSSNSRRTAVSRRLSFAWCCASWQQVQVLDKALYAHGMSKFVNKGKAKKSTAPVGTSWYLWNMPIACIQAMPSAWRQHVKHVKIWWTTMDVGVKENQSQLHRECKSSHVRYEFQNPGSYVYLYHMYTCIYVYMHVYVNI